MVMKNCGRCGKPLYTDEQICEGCRKALSRKTAREHRRYEREEKLEEKFREPGRDVDKQNDFFWVEDDEYQYDARAVWVDDKFSKKKKKKSGPKKG
ncbi:hypothetical protein ACFLRC_02510 [Candidatus Altiarchaeota archaeon]